MGQPRLTEYRVILLSKEIVQSLSESDSPIPIEGILILVHELIWILDEVIQLVKIRQIPDQLELPGSNHPLAVQPELSSVVGGDHRVANREWLE
jgi:hypothetical protein